MTSPFGPDYPPARYHGDPHTDTVLRPASTAHDLEYPNGVKVSYLARSTTTDGDFGLYRWDFSSAVSGPDPHFHRSMSESFFVLEGTVRLFEGTRWVDAKAGDFLYVPPGGAHGFKNESGEPASMLLLFTPGAPREHYFEGLLRMAEGWDPSPEERAAFFVHHDNLSVD